MLRIRDIPLSVLNRALELYGEPPEPTVAYAKRALISAEGRKDAPGPFTPFAFAIAEYLSLRGPWDEEAGEHAGESGYLIEG